VIEDPLQTSTPTFLAPYLLIPLSSNSDQLVDTDDLKDAKIEDKRSLHNRTIAKLFKNLDDYIL
jgi:hypothetical protein